jgi:hypothetical protein
MVHNPKPRKVNPMKTDILTALITAAALLVCALAYFDILTK